MTKIMMPSIILFQNKHTYTTTKKIVFIKKSRNTDLKIKAYLPLTIFTWAMRLNIYL